MANAELPEEDPREILGGVAASLRAYLEWQQETGATGIPRRPKGVAPTAAAAPPVSATVTREAREAREAPPPSIMPSSAAAPSVSPSTPLPSFPPSPSSRAPVSISEALPPMSEPTPKSSAKAPASVAVPVPSAPPRALPVIAEEVRACTKCALGATRIQTVFARGNPEAKLCFVGEAPGADEDEQGLPFVGRAGQLLDKMIQAMGLDPAKDVYVCNIIKCRPPGNRKPEPSEIESCIPYLHEQLASIKPKAIVALGNTAVGALLGTKLGITKVRGSWKLYRGAIPVMPTYHPSYLLRPSAQQVEAKKQAWEDLQAVMKELGLGPPKPKKG
jgi:DNA polymerase